MTQRFLAQAQSRLKPNPYCRRDRAINILLLGQTGVGKSTFINAFANYIVNDSLNDAANDEMQAIVPCSFSYTMHGTSGEDIEKMITIGEQDEHEQFSDTGHSNTQQCRSFVFPICDRNLRFIDTPGVGGTRSMNKMLKIFKKY
ncbi:unnamed protein product [Rotaria sordida]|uniref:G domain-containing protein n=1 Tax=Rotaria sordida TaxID=392033 RepID=A0A815QKV3_9BILA|nr:unnamed protein product [Rotaria sordida]CAF1642869.1 unnamed protein product [Rotaria sordida]